MVNLADFPAGVQRLPAPRVTLAEILAEASWLPTYEDECWYRGHSACENGGRRRCPPSLIGHFRAAWLGGFDQCREDLDRGTFLEGFEAGERFALRVAPADLSARDRKGWLRGYDKGREAIEAEALAELAERDRASIGAYEDNDFPF